MKPITSHLSKSGFDSLRKSRNIQMEKSSTAIGEMYPSHCSPNVMQRRPKGWPSVRAQVRLQRACATRPIEKTGDSSTPLRMTCVAITIGEPLSPHLRRNCHPEEAERLAKRPRTGSSSKGMCYTSNREDGRFFDSAQNDMRCDNHWRTAEPTPSAKLSSRGGRQADEGSTAASDHPRAICTFRYLSGSTSTAAE